MQNCTPWQESHESIVPNDSDQLRGMREFGIAENRSYTLCMGSGSTCMPQKLQQTLNSDVHDILKSFLSHFFRVGCKRNEKVNVSLPVLHFEEKEKGFPKKNFISYKNTEYYSEF